MWPDTYSTALTSCIVYHTQTCHQTPVCPLFTLQQLNMDAELHSVITFIVTNSKVESTPPCSMLALAFERKKKPLRRPAAAVGLWLFCVAFGIVSWSVGWLDAAGWAIHWQPGRNLDYSEVGMFVSVVVVIVVVVLALLSLSFPSPAFPPW